MQPEGSIARWIRSALDKSQKLCAAPKMIAPFAFNPEHG